MVAKGVDGLLLPLLGNFENRSGPNEPPSESSPHAQTTAGTAVRVQEAALDPIRNEGGVTLPVIVYATYITGCLVIFLYWQLRKQRS